MDIYEARRTMQTQRKNIFDLNLRVTFYARVSTTRDEQENSIENQIIHFENMIKENKNWTYVSGYADRIRGESAANRVEFQKMVDDAKAGAFDLVLTKEVSRFARNTIDSLTYTRDLLQCGVGVFFQNDNICTIDPDSELRLTIMSSIAADEVRKLSERIKFGHKRAAESGRLLGNSRIFGYTKVNCKLIIDEKEAEMVRLIFNLYETGSWSTRSIATELEKRGYLGRNGTPIHHNTVSGIIQNPKYKGYYCANKVTITDYRTKAQRFNPEEEWIMYKDETGETVPAIVSEDQWNACNVIFKERSSAIKARTRSIKSQSPLSGKIKCSEHGTYWRTSYSNSVSQGKPIYQWICREKKRQTASCCKSFALMESEIYKILNDVYKSIISDIDEWVSEFLKIYESVTTTESGKSKIAVLESNIQKLKVKQDRLLDLYMDEAITKSEYSDKASELNAKLDDAKSELESLKNPDTGESIIDPAKRIKTYIQEICGPESRDMTIDELNDISRVVLDFINVIPVDRQTMKLEIKLKSSELKSVDVSSHRSGRCTCCSGHITKKISPEQQYQFVRSGIKNGMSLYLVYIVCVGF